MTVIEFLRARLAEDEQAAKHAVEGPASLATEWHVDRYRQGSEHHLTVADADGVVIAPELGRQADHIARHDPARAAEFVRFVRMMIAIRNGLVADDHECEQCDGYRIEIAMYDAIFRDMAKIWRTHPDYQEKWPA